MPNSFVLVINSGSSSLKFAIIDVETGCAVLSGLGECFGLPEASVSWKYNEEHFEQKINNLENNHLYVIQLIVRIIQENNLTENIVALGHRIVHGGEKFTKTIRITASVLKEIENLSDLAPLHNPAGAVGIHAAMNAFPILPQFAVFDTAFHQSR